MGPSISKEATTPITIELGQIESKSIEQGGQSAIDWSKMPGQIHGPTVGGAVLAIVTALLILFLILLACNKRFRKLILGNRCARRGATEARTGSQTPYPRAPLTKKQSTAMLKLLDNGFHISIHKNSPPDPLTETSTCDPGIHRPHHLFDHAVLPDTGGRVAMHGAEIHETGATPMIGATGLGPAVPTASVPTRCSWDPDTEGCHGPSPASPPGVLLSHLADRETRQGLLPATEYLRPGAHIWPQPGRPLTPWHLNAQGQPLTPWSRDQGRPLPVWSNQGQPLTQCLHQLPPRSPFCLPPGNHAQHLECPGKQASRQMWQTWDRTPSMTPNIRNRAQVSPGAYHPWEIAELPLGSRSQRCSGKQASHQMWQMWGQSPILTQDRDLAPVGQGAYYPGEITELPPGSQSTEGSGTHRELGIQPQGRLDPIMASSHNSLGAQGNHAQAPRDRGTTGEGQEPRHPGSLPPNNQGHRPTSQAHEKGPQSPPKLQSPAAPRTQAPNLTANQPPVGELMADFDSAVKNVSQGKHC